MTRIRHAQKSFSWSEVGYAFGGITLLCVTALSLAYASWPNGSGGSETFRFITLLIIFMTALTAAAGVFVWLGIDSPRQAFAFPPGSVRVLLAIGIMVLFVVFGLPAVSPLPPSEAHPATTPLTTLSVPSDKVDAVVKLHRSEGYTVLVKDYVAGTSATLEVYATVKERPAAEMDLVKQLLTALVTALTIVIGFYFGSRSAGDAASLIERVIRGDAPDSTQAGPKASTPPARPGRGPLN